MSKQRYIQDSFWTDPYIEKLDPSEKLLFLYFLTNPLCNIAGIYEIRNNRVAYDTGFDKEMVDKIKQRFVGDGKMLIVDDWVVLANFAKHQTLNPNVKAGMQRILNDLPEKVKALKGFESLSYFTLLNLTLPNGSGINPKSSEKEKEVKKEFELPIWVDKQVWQEWLDYRKQAKYKKYTEIGLRKLFKELEPHKYDFKAIVNNSITKGWQGLFPIKKNFQSDRKEIERPYYRKAQREVVSEKEEEEEKKRIEIIKNQIKTFGTY